jgi:tRNA(fMet)-specific endonuclease VapC
MRRFLLDTNSAGKFISRRDGVYERAIAESASGNRVGICHPVLAELAFGAEYSESRERNMQRLRLALAAWRLWPVTQEAAFEYGRVAAELRAAGRVIQQNDIMIAAIARSLGNCTVVTTDSDFSFVVGLTIENWVVPVVDSH